MRYRCPKFFQHQAEAILVGCIDFRFWEITGQFVAENVAPLVDAFNIPGVAKNFLEEGNLFARSAIAAIQKSIDLHQISSIILMAHWDCGGYGGSKKFPSPTAEETAYRDDLMKAREKLAAQFSLLNVRAGYSRPAPKPEWADPAVAEIEFVMIN
jgi:carbonic anhydrase